MGNGPHWSEKWSEVVVAGEPDFRLAIRVSGYEFPGDASGSDADWMVAWIELCIGGQVKARIKNDACLRGEELAGFGKELHELLARRARNAELVTLEEMVSLEIERAGERFVLGGALTDHGSLNFDFDRITIDTASLERMVAGLDALLGHFPPRPESRACEIIARLPKPTLRKFLTRSKR